MTYARTYTKYLTPAHIRILALFADGLTTTQVAARCGVSESTIKCQLVEARHRLGTNSRVHTVAVALRRGIIE